MKKIMWMKEKSKLLEKKTFLLHFLSKNQNRSIEFFQMINFEYATKRDKNKKHRFWFVSIYFSKWIEHKQKIMRFVYSVSSVCGKYVQLFFSKLMFVLACSPKIAQDFGVLDKKFKKFAIYFWFYFDSSKKIKFTKNCQKSLKKLSENVNPLEFSK